MNVMIHRSLGIVLRAGFIAISAKIGIRECLSLFLVLVGVAGSAMQVSGQEVQTGEAVCGDPSAGCGRSFQPNDLSFTLPGKMKWQTNYYSAPFYAVILKSRPVVRDVSPMDEERCSGGYFSESERSRIQTLFPSNKVFASRNGCYMPLVWYTGTNSDYEFLAVYAGLTKAAATTFWQTVKARGFSDANVRLMKVVYGNGD